MSRGFPGGVPQTPKHPPWNIPRVRRQRWAHAHPARGSGVRSFVAGHPGNRVAGHERAQRAGAVGTGRTGLGEAAECGWPASAPFHGWIQPDTETAVADKQCAGLQTLEMWGQYPPAVPFS